MELFLSKLWENRSGNIAMSAALVAVPIIGACGIALDFTTAYAKRRELQNAADAAVLHAAASRETDKKKLVEIATNVFAANVTTQFASAEVTSIEVTDNNYITLQARANISLGLGQILRPQGIEVSIVSQALKASADEVEVALVLDNTYSMTGQKLTDLKAASNSLLDVFENADKDKSMARLAIVPFSRYVNVGMAHRNQSWLSVPDDYSTTTHSCTTSRPVISQSGCTSTTKTAYNDGVPYTYTHKSCSETVYGEPVTTCSDRTSTYKWSGCVGSRISPYDVKDTEPSRKYTGLLNTSCGSAITPLTDDYQALRSAIKSMTANSETYIAPGVMWGWNMLSSEAPFQEGLAYKEDVKKIMVVMTDGENTLSAKNYPLHDGNDKKKANEKLLTVCENAKERNIIIFTVGVGISDTATADELAKCASDKSKAFSVEHTKALVEVFRSIGNQILSPRLTM